MSRERAGAIEQPGTVADVDARPPRLSSDERRTLLAHLQFQRESLLRKVDGLTAAQVRASPVESGTSLLWLLRHAGFAESIWVLDRFARLDIDNDLLCNDLQPHDTFDSLDARYRRVWKLVDNVVTDSPLDATCQVDDDMDNPNLRWVIVHLCTETARDAGHADIVRELIDNTTGR